MRQTIGSPEVDEGPRPDLIGERSQEEVRDLLRRRRLNPHTVAMYLGTLRKAEAFCRVEGLSLDVLSPADLARFAATLHQSRPVLSSARTALSHYWSATGRRGYPSIQVTELVGVRSKDPLEGHDARERADATALGGASSQPPLWAETGYDRAWLVDRFRARQLVRKTAQGHANQLAGLARWCLKRGTTIDTIGPNELEEYAQGLPLTRSTRMALRTALVHYYAVTLRPDPPLWAVRVPRRTRMVCRALEDDAARSLEAAALGRDDPKGLAVVIGLYLGLRRFEISKLEWTDLRDGWLHVVGKGDVEAVIPVHPVVTSYLERHPNGSPFVFPGRFGGSLNPATLWGWVRDVSQEAGLGNVSTHILRHTALASGNDGTGDLRSVQDFARHAEPTTTAGYTRTTKRRLLAVSDAIGDFYDPPGGTEGDPEISEAPTGPTLSFADLILTLEGAHAVEAWLELAGTLEGRPGWRLEGIEGAGAVHFVFPAGNLAASATTWTNDRPATFAIERMVGPTVEDLIWWEIGDAEALDALLATFEGGGVPFPPTGSFVAEETETVE